MKEGGSGCRLPTLLGSSGLHKDFPFNTHRTDTPRPLATSRDKKRCNPRAGIAPLLICSFEVLQTTKHDQPHNMF